MRSLFWCLKSPCMYVLGLDMDTMWIKKKRITSLSSSLTTMGNICVLAFPRFIFQVSSCKFGIFQVRFKRDSDKLSSSFSHLVSALSGWICVRVTPAYMAKTIKVNIKEEKKKLQYGPCFHQLWYGSVHPNAAAFLSRYHIWFVWYLFVMADPFHIKLH